MMGDKRDGKGNVRLSCIIVGLFGMMGSYDGARATNLQDSYDYRVRIDSVGNPTVDKTLTDTSNLAGLQKTKAVSAFALAGRIKSDYTRLKTAMDSFGYYDAKIIIHVSGAAIDKASEKTSGKISENKNRTAKNISHSTQPELTQSEPTLMEAGKVMDGNDPELPAYITQLSTQRNVLIHVQVEKGAKYHIGRITFIKEANKQQSPASSQSKDKEQSKDQNKETFQLTEPQQKAFGLRSGQAAISADIVEAKSRLLDTLREEGHALARISEPVAYLHPETKMLDVVYPMDMGPVVDLGTIEFQGLDKMNPAFVRKRLLLHSGQLYQPSSIEKARQDLSSLGVFSSIDVTAGDHLDHYGHIPLILKFKEAKRRTVSAEVGYSTDLGGKLGGRWTHHNLLGNAEELKLAAMATGIGGTAQKGLGYDLYADFSKPDFGNRNQNFNGRVEAVKQKLYSYNQTAFLARAGINRILTRHWQISVFLGGIQEHIIQQGERNDYTMVNIPLSVAFDNTDLPSPMMSPTHGVKALVSVTPTESFGNGSVFFTILQGTGSTYFDLSHLGLAKAGRSILAFRGNLGSIQGSSQMNLPPDQRLYAGGTSTVRGFRYQGVGPQFKGTKYAKGGKAMDTGSVEFRQRLFSQFGGQIFMDAGQVSEDSMPFKGTVRVGAGGGVKYYTPMGPIRLDVAVPIKRPYRGDRFEVYIGLGETF